MRAAPEDVLPLHSSDPIARAELSTVLVSGASALESIPARTSIAKRIIDIALGGTLLLLALPVMILLGLIVVVTSPGPALFRQTRVGLDGSKFVLWKLRTMRVGAESEVAGLRVHHEVDDVLFKLVDDPRITGIGRFLRRCSLDELPQLAHVVTGRMSLVGPRPALPEEVAEYSNRVQRRLAVRPGLTGLWQVSGRSDLPWETAIALDLQYVEEGSVRMDLSILRRTIGAVLFGRGAY